MYLKYMAWFPISSMVQKIYIDIQIQEKTKMAKSPVQNENVKS